MTLSNSANETGRSGAVIPASHPAGFEVPKIAISSLVGPRTERTERHPANTAIAKPLVSETQRH